MLSEWAQLPLGHMETFIHAGMLVLPMHKLHIPS